MGLSKKWEAPFMFTTQGSYWEIKRLLIATMVLIYALFSHIGLTKKLNTDFWDSPVLLSDCVCNYQGRRISAHPSE
jgi:hypothetical protein